MERKVAYISDERLRLAAHSIPAVKFRVSLLKTVIFAVKCDKYSFRNICLIRGNLILLNAKLH